MLYKAGNKAQKKTGEGGRELKFPENGYGGRGSNFRVLNMVTRYMEKGVGDWRLILLFVSLNFVHSFNLFFVSKVDIYYVLFFF